MTTTHARDVLTEPPRPTGAVAGWSALPAWSRQLLAALLLLASCGLLVGGYVGDQRALSPFDEWTYSDYLDKAAQGGLAQRGEPIDRYALELSSCRGVFPYGLTGSPCGGPYQPAQYPLGGVTSADIHPPTYFWATALIAQPLLALGLTDDLLTAGRLVGALWLALGLGLLHALARRLGASVLAASAVCLAVAVSPLVRYTNSYVTPDSLNLAVGAGVVLVALAWLDRRARWPALVAVGALATAVKAQNVLALGAAAALVLVLAAVQADGPLRARLTAAATRRAAAGGALLVAAGGAAAAGWLALHGALALGGTPDQGLALTPLSWDVLLRETTVFVRRLGVGAIEDGQPVPLRGEVLSWLLIGGTVGAVLHGSGRLRAAGAVVLTALLLAGPALLVLVAATSGGVFASPTRYGMSLLPLYAAVTAAAVRGRAAGTALLAVWVAAAAALLVRLL